MAKNTARKVTLEADDKLTLFFKENESDKVFRELQKHFRVTLKLNAVGMLVIRGEKNTTAEVEEYFDRIKKTKKNIVIDDIYSILEGRDVEEIENGAPDKNDWSRLQFRNKTGSFYTVAPKSENQRLLIQEMLNKKVIFAGGSAGAGKTFIACAVALKFLEEKLIKKIVVTRPHVASEEFGFLPGTIDEKMAPFLYPIFSIFEEIIGREKRDAYIAKGQIEILPVAFSRGVTLGGQEGIITIIDECENLTVKQAYLMLTRLGGHINSKIIFAGDELQTDLKRNENVLSLLKKILKDSPYVGFIDFNSGDVVRSEIVKDILKRFEEYDAKQKEDKDKK